jgi:nitrogen fixation-related uncharacterized protein
MDTILIGLAVAALAIGLLFMAFRPAIGARKFEDLDQDGEPDETPEERRLAREILLADEAARADLEDRP